MLSWPGRRINIQSSSKNSLDSGSVFMRIICGLLFIALGKPFHCDCILLGNHLLTSVFQPGVLCTPHISYRLTHSLYILYMLIVFIVFLVKSTPISTSHLEGEGRRSSFTYSLRNPHSLPAGSQGRVQLLQGWAITCHCLHIGTGSTGYLFHFDWFVLVWPLLGLWMPLEDRSWNLLRASGPLYGCCKITEDFQGSINFLTEQNGLPGSNEMADQHFILFSLFSLWPLVVYIEYASCYPIPEKASFLQGFLSIDLYNW